MKKLFFLLIIAISTQAYDFFPGKIKLPSPEFVIKTDKKIYKSGEIPKVTIDTKGKKGYLYLFVTFGDTFVVMFPNKYYKDSIIVEGKYDFPESFDKLKDEFKFQVTNDSTDEKEETKLVAIISEEKLNIMHDSDRLGTIAILNEYSKKAKRIRTLLMKGMMVVSNKKKKRKIFSSFVDFNVTK